MAEGLVNYTRLDDDLHTILTTQGRPISPDDEVWVADSDGNALPANTTGRLMTRGPYTFRGYYKSPEHNAQSFDQQGFYAQAISLPLMSVAILRFKDARRIRLTVAVKRSPQKRLKTFYSVILLFFTRPSYR